MPFNLVIRNHKLNGYYTELTVKDFLLKLKDVKELKEFYFIGGRQIFNEFCVEGYFPVYQFSLFEKKLPTLFDVLKKYKPDLLTKYTNYGKRNN
jgi:dihydrofolate reductase